MLGTGPDILVGRERAEPSWRPGPALSYRLYTGPLCSVCVNRFGCRPVMLVGGLFASLGMVAASFCRSIIQIYLTTGVITGESGTCRPQGVRRDKWVVALLLICFQFWGKADCWAPGLYPSLPSTTVYDSSDTVLRGVSGQCLGSCTLRPIRSSPSFAMEPTSREAGARTTVWGDTGV